MDWQTAQSSSSPAERCEQPHAPEKRLTRRRLIQYSVLGGACAAGGLWLLRHLLGSGAESVAAAARSTDVFKNDAPQGPRWEQWLARGWAREASHYLRLGRNVQCKLCPNECLLEPDDRGRCRNRVNKEGTLYTLAFGNACSMQVDPIEKKPLFHFAPGTDVFSFAASGCGFRCLNCQNWEISQRRPEETKDASGPELRVLPERLAEFTLSDMGRATLWPEDAVALADFFRTPSIAYTYSEPSVWFEYMIDTARKARARGIRNVWVTCGYIQQQPLEELCQVLDAANVDLKSFDPQVYGKLNSGTLEPILGTLQTLRRHGVWFEVTNLVVPTYTDDLEMIRRMCLWMVDHLGPDYPLHFSRFHPAHKLTHLPPTPVEVLVDARGIALDCGLRYVYIGNVRGVEGAETTFCPNCHKAVVERDIFFVESMKLEAGCCTGCGTPIAGVWA